MRHLKIRDDLYLIEQVVSGVERTRNPVNHIWIADRSGSMYYELPGLIEDLKAKSRTLTAGDTLTFGWFSSENGQYGFPVKGYRIANDDDFTRLDAMFDAHKQVLGTTCFSEVLSETLQVVEDLKPLSQIFSFWLLTDGYPVVGNYSQEVKQIEQCLRQLGLVLSGAQFVGYGDFYNKSLMADMARWAAGSLIHSSTLSSTSRHLMAFIEQQMGLLKQVVDVEGEPQFAFTLKQGDPVIYDIQNKQAWVYPEEQAFSVYSIGSAPVGASVPENLFLLHNQGDNPVERGFVSATYAAAALLSQQLRTDDAIALMRVSGDRYCMRQLDSAFSVAEYGDIESRLQHIAKHPDQSHIDGYESGYNPPDDAFCLVDLLEMVLSDPNAQFYPNHEAFSYKRIGRPSHPKAGYPEFTPYGEGCSLESLTWHKEKINLSVLARIPGSVDLGEEAEAVGLPQTFHTHIWRNFTIVRDGNLWTSKLPVSLSRKTWEALYAHHLFLNEENWQPNPIFVLDLYDLPIINRRLAVEASHKTVGDVASLAVEEQKLAARIKVCKAVLNEVAPDEPILPSYTPEQQAFLESKGIGRNGFSPSTERESGEDFYFAPTLSIKVSGFSSLPSLSDIVSLVATSRLSPAKQIMVEELTYLDAVLTDFRRSQVIPAGIDHVKERLEDLKTQQRVIRRQLQKIKFSVLMGKRWFKGADSRDIKTTHNEFTVTIKLGEVKVPI